MGADKSVYMFLVDDHPIIRMGFRRLIEQLESFSVAGEAGSGEEALDRIPETRTDLVLVDISMPGMDGIALTGHLKRMDPDIGVIVVSMHDETHYVEKALQVGADGYILKDNVNDLLEEAAREVLAGRIYLCSEVQDRLS